jgi:general secretion pathway protein B
MSYILEALKKAQAERQLGSAPTIHAAQPLPAAPAAPAGQRKPWLIGLGAGAAVVAVAGAVLLWRPASGPAPAARADALAPAAPDAASPAAAANPPAVSVATTLAVSAPPAPVEPPSRAPQSAPRPSGPAIAAPPSATVPASVRAPAPEDNLPYLQQLPDALRSAIPAVSFGGYMYSANPADRLLLVDKALRHEGEELAPGLILEKLLPKAAVLNYRGTRYRVAL